MQGVEKDEENYIAGQYANQCRQVQWYSRAQALAVLMQTIGHLI